MNAPLERALSEAAQSAEPSPISTDFSASLDDKYTLQSGLAFMSGIQALVRLPMLQQNRDAKLGKNTAGFISGYRGSPLGGYDQALVKAQKYLKQRHITFQPGVNEELAATALWGTQQLGFAPKGSNRYDGVFGIWYGKGPGVDRCCDVFKHANMAGTTPWGGVIAVAGDDHVAKSSTAVHQSDHIFKACGFPVFFPTSVQEILDLGLHAFALSRFAGVWSGMKTIQEIVESSAVVDVSDERVRILLPTDFEMPPGGVHIRWPDHALDQEKRLFDYKWYAALAYVRANRLNRNVIEGPHDRLGLIASGKAYNDTRQALSNLGLDDETCRQLGIRLHKVSVVWPLEAQLTREFATGLQDIMVIEEKRQIIEYQLKEELYNWRSDVRPNVVGKFEEQEGDFSGGEWSNPNPSANTLLRANADLSPALIARAMAKRIMRLGLDEDMKRRVQSQLDLLEAKERSMQVINLASATAPQRLPWFCSGCPHNTSTRVPAGSRAMAGIGCHFMTIWMDRSTYGFTQMGGEGVPWVGQQPFSTEQHMFANLGDGTYFHSGLLAIRQSIAAGVNITYKILYNDAVAMTGGQQVGERPEGHSVVQIAQSMRAEGVAKLVIVTDEPAKYEGVAGIPDGVSIEHRDRLESIQLDFRTIKGTTVIIYDQTCATEKRRRRKRGSIVDPDLRVIINPAVCEGCGDCSEQSNCVSVEPLETEFGRKRQINQSSCNKDFSCVNGFCPSFVTVKGGKLKKPKAAPSKGSAAQFPELPVPSIPKLDTKPGRTWGIVVAGVGGTGVITIGQLLGMAAHLEGKGVVTQDAAGLAQKGGATWSHVIIGASQQDIFTTRVGSASADLVIGCDPVVAAGKDTLVLMQSKRTHIALNSHVAPTAAFIHNPDWQEPAERCLSDIASVAGSEDLATLQADAMAKLLLGDAIYTNPIMLGYTWQKGWVPLGLESLMRSIELNAVDVEQNKAAFEWGRRMAAFPDAVQKLLTPAQVIQFIPKTGSTLKECLERRVAFLQNYQDAAFARNYSDFIQKVMLAEKALGLEAKPDEKELKLTRAVAENLFKLMAVKDEFEVARLHSDPAFLQSIADTFEGDYTLQYHLAPPMMARRNEKGELQKRIYGSWMLGVFKMLAPMKFLRAGVFDIFGYSSERREERDLLQRYRKAIEALLPALTKANHAQAVSFASLPEKIRGYGHVRQRNLKQVLKQWDGLLIPPLQ